MSIPAIEGIVENGQIRLIENVVLPERSKVFVFVPDLRAIPQARAVSPRLAHPEQASDFAKQVVETTDDVEL